MPQQITLKIDLEDQFLRDIMVTMVESGNDALWYWADGDPEFFEDLKVERNSDLDVTTIQFGITCRGCRRMSRCTHTDHYVIDGVNIAKAIEHLLSTWPLADDLMAHLSRGVREGDAGEIDSTLADCIAQFVCFGELVYS